MRLSRVTLRVGDQLEALQFYTQVMGFAKSADFPLGEGQRWITVSAPDDSSVQIVLQPADWFTGEQRERHLQYVGYNPPLVFEVEDCAAVFQRLSERGVRFTLPPTQRPYGIEANAVDTEGNTLVFLEILADNAQH